MRLILILFTLVIGVSAHAGLACTGTVSNVTIGPGGMVTVSGADGLSWAHVCSVSSAIGGITVDSCKSIYATFMAAQLAGKQVTMWFSNSSNSTCAEHAAMWSWKFIDTGDWYEGPSIN